MHSIAYGDPVGSGVASFRDIATESVVTAFEADEDAVPIPGFVEDRVMTSPFITLESTITLPIPRCG